MGIRLAYPLQNWLRACLLACLCSGLLSHTAASETLTNLTRTVWGCVDPNVSAPINDPLNPARSDPRWIARTSVDGQCTILSPVGQWATLSEDHNGLTYIGHRGAIGPSGSFWVPTTALAVHVAPEALATARTSAVSKAQPTETPASQKLLPVAQVAPDAKISPTPPASIVIAPDAEPARLPTQPSSSRGDGWGGILTVFGILVALGMAVSSRGRKQSKGRTTAKPDNQTNTTKSASGVNFRIDPSSLSDIPKRADAVGATGPNQFPPTSTGNHKRTTIDSVDFRIRSESLAHGPETTVTAATQSEGTWHPPGTEVTIGKTVIEGGMVYVGHFTGRYGPPDGCLIDPKLPVGSAAAAGPLGYWPSYKDISPECRKRYLDWLASGKQAVDIDIGYVFLYFYGLERRLLVDTAPPAEIRTLVQELERLRSLYASNRSFERYSHNLLEAVKFLENTGGANGSLFIPDLGISSGDMPLSLKTAIAREVVAGRPLRFELAAAALFGLREFWSNHRHVIDKGRLPFLTVLRPRFSAAFPAGFVVRNRKDSRMQLFYRGAAAGLNVDLTLRTGLKDLPDPMNLTWTKLLVLADTVANDLSPYIKVITYYPTRATSIAGLINCPPELRDSIAVEDRRWLEGLPSPASVPFEELAKHTIGAESTKWTVRHRRQISAALSVVGYAMEPGSEDTTERLEDGTVVQVFRSTSDSQSRPMIVASAAAMLVASVVKANKGAADKLEEFWLSQLPSRLSLPTDQMTRLRARLTWYRTNSVGLPKVKRMLGEATLEEREFCAWSATVAASVSGNIDKPQIAVLEAIHDALSVPRAALYVGLHAGIGAATAGADEPVAVSHEAPEILHPIPRPPVAEPSGPDMDRLARIRADTERVSAMLADIFAENESAPEMPEHAGEGPLAGLNTEHANLLTKLLASTGWTRQEFNVAATKIGLMPDGAMEAINEWAFDRYGDALVEDGDPLLVNLALLSEDLAEITVDQ